MEARASSRDNAIGIFVTLALHGLVLLALFLIVIHVTPPDPPLPEGMEIDFGMDNEGSGKDIMALPTGPVVSNNPSETPLPVKAAKESPQEVMTSQNSEDVVAMPKPDKKPVTETPKPVEKPKPTINQGALLPGQKSTGGQGTSDKPGNEGRLDGIPNGGKGGRGNNPNGIGEGTVRTTTPTNTRINMAGRSVTYAPSFTYNEQEDGIVVVKVTADRNGNVIDATTDGVKGSTTTNKALHSLAIANAKRYKFDVKPDAAPEQIGHITFVFNRN